MMRSRSLDLAVRCVEALKAVFGDQSDVLEGFMSRAREAAAQLYYSEAPICGDLHGPPRQARRGRTADGG
jgi:hypothetical protein